MSEKSKSATHARVLGNMARSPGKLTTRPSSGHAWHLDTRTCRSDFAAHAAHSTKLAVFPWGAPASTSIHRVFNTQGSEMMGLDRIEADPSKELRQGRYRSRASRRATGSCRHTSRFMSARIGPIVPRSSCLIVPHHSNNSHRPVLTGRSLRSSRGLIFLGDFVCLKTTYPRILEDSTAFPRRQGFFRDFSTMGPTLRGFFA